jgi:hypothetical protein
MGDIRYFRHDDEAVLAILANAFATKNLVPVIGSGFTVGCATEAKRTVPSGTKFQEEMLNSIFENNSLDEKQKEKLKQKKFSELADFYFDEKWVPTSTVRKHLEEAFKGVDLPVEQREFLNDIDWPYLYTLNIDDAIERNSRFVPALPYNDNLSVRAKEQPTVFKLHGDIAYELRHDDNRLIFRRGDYLQSLTQNRRMLEFLKLDLINKNIIYIGCSLADELDISFIVSKQTVALRRDVRNIIFLNEKLDAIDEQQYANIGINCVILFDPGSYFQIYDVLKKSYQASAAVTNSLKVFSNSIRLLGNEKKINEDFLISGVVEINESKKKYSRILPHYYCPRDVEGDIKSSLEKNEITVIMGARVSGRTLVAYGVLSNIKDRAIYIVDSTYRLDGKALLQLLGQKNAVIFFDSTSYAYDDLKTIARLRRGLIGAGSRILLCSDRMNGEAEQLLCGPGEKTGIVIIDNKLSQRELLKLNSLAIEASLPTFTTGKYLLDKVYNVFSIIGEQNKISKITMTKELFKVLYVLSIRNQMTGQEIHFAGIDFTDVSKIVKDNQPFIQFDEIDVGEHADHTNYKIFTHASSWVVAALREFYKAKGVDWCVDSLMELFTDFYDFDKNIVIELRRFDSINFVFTSGNFGASNLILRLYDRLEVLEGTEAEFFVQKSKAYYNMYHGKDLRSVLNDRIVELNKALTWAKTDHNVTSVRNINHVKALICLRRAVDVQSPTEGDVMEALNSVLLSINSENNVSYVKNFLTGEIRGADYLHEFQNIVQNNSYKYPVLLTVKGKIQELDAKISAARAEIKRKLL